MVSYKIVDDTFLFAEASQTSVRLFPLLADTVMNFPQGKPGGDFINFIFVPEGGIPTPGFVLRSKCQELPDAPATAVEEETFIRECLIAERSINTLDQAAPWYVVADFVIARALIETDLQNTGTVVDGLDGIGPLQVTTEEWKDFLDNAKPLSGGFLPDDRVFPTLQVYGAAYRMHKDCKAISEEKSQGNQADKSDGPFLASYLDVFHCYLASSAKAAVAILAAQENDQGRGKKLADILSEKEIAAIAAHPKFKGKVTGSMTVGDLVKATEEVLGAALKSAFDLIKKHAPEQVPAPPAAGGQAPWFAIARAEEQLHVSNETNPRRIKDYFDATDFGHVSDADPIPSWCGAFVANCIKKSGAAAPIPKGAATAANWKLWGQSLPAASTQPPVGAVVVLSPAPGTNSSGHVAFFDSAPPGQVKLLGGNQSKSVNFTSYSLGRLVALRWFDVGAGMGAATGQFNLKATGVPQERWKFADMIADRFARAGYGKVHQVAAVANAIGESNLDPGLVNRHGESSIGLFQCNQNGGLGAGRTDEQLKDPETNISIVLAEARKFAQFKNATTIQDAVGAFVTFVERPRRPDLDIPKRVQIAQELVS